MVYDDNSGGKFVPCRGGFGAYCGVWFENIVSGISRDILVEAMFRVEAAGYPIVMHVHDELVCEVPEGFRQRAGIPPADDAAGRPGRRICRLPPTRGAGLATTNPTSREAGAAPRLSQKRAEEGQETIT